MELYRFVDTLRLNCEGYTMHEAWHMFCKMKDWQDSFPHLMKLWHATLVIPFYIQSISFHLFDEILLREPSLTHIVLDGITKVVCHNFIK